MPRLPTSSHAGLDQRLLARLKLITISPSAPLCVAFSGGNDSLALAIALSRITRSFKLKPVLVHIDHQLRPRSGQDALRCQALAEAVGLQLIVTTLSKGMADRATGVGIEEQARRERYLALSDHCQALGAEILVTAHQLDDQAETVLMHLFRGSGLRGAAGMRELSTLRVPWWVSPRQLIENNGSLQLWRPLLSEPREMLEAYVAAAGLNPVIDESNESLDFRRNVVRQKILPVAAQHWPGTVEALFRFARAVGRDEDYLTEQTSILESEAITTDGALRIHVVLNSHAAVSSRLVGEWFRRSGVHDLTMDRIDEILHLARCGSESTLLEVGSNRCVVRFGGTLRIGCHTALTDYALQSVPGPWQLRDAIIETISVRTGSSTTTASGTGWLLRCSIADQPAAKAEPNIKCHSHPLHHVPELTSLTIRRVEAGDRWLGSGAPVRDSMRQAGVHPLARDSVICVAIGSEVVCIPGIQQPSQSGDMKMEPVAWLNLQWKTRKQAS